MRPAPKPTIFTFAHALYQIQRGLRVMTKVSVPFEEASRKILRLRPPMRVSPRLTRLRSGQFRFDIADELTKMRAAAEKAIQLDPLLAEAHDALGMAYARDGQWEQSEKSFRRAIELDPGRSESHGHFATFVLLPLGRIEEAIHHLQVAEKANPLSGPVHYQLAFALMSAGRHEEAAARCQMLPADFGQKTECLAEAQLGQGKIDEAIRILEAGDLKEGGRFTQSASGQSWLCLHAGGPSRRGGENCRRVRSTT